MVTRYRPRMRFHRGEVLYVAKAAPGNRMRCGCRLEVHRYGFAARPSRQGNRDGLSRIGNIARRAVTKEPHAAAGVVAPKVIGIAAAAGIQIAGAIETGVDAAAVEILADDIDGR